MGTKNEPGTFDCYMNALPDEPMFILLARDPTAARLVDRWADMREYDISVGVRPDNDIRIVEEARHCAAKMRQWRKANNGKWRRS